MATTSPVVELVVVLSFDARRRRITDRGAIGDLVGSVFAVSQAECEALRARRSDDSESRFVYCIKSAASATLRAHFRPRPRRPSKEVLLV